MKKTAPSWSRKGKVMRKFFIATMFASMVLVGCNADLTKVPAEIQIDQEKALEVWDYLMVRRSNMFEEMSNPATSPERKEELQKIITSENDLFNIVINYYMASGQQVQLEIIPPGIGNADSPLDIVR